MQGGEQEAGVVRTVVWGTDINVQEVLRQFTAFVREFRVQTEDETGSMVLDAGAKYMKYLEDVRPSLLPVLGVHSRHLSEVLLAHPRSTPALL